MKRQAGYTLIEVLAAGAILMIAVAAAGALALATVTQEEINFRIARCLNLQEQGARLYQLGLDPNYVLALLPADPAVTSLSFTTENLAIPGLGTVEQAGSTIVFNTSPSSGNAWSPGTWTSGPGSAFRTNQVVIIRPSIR